MFDKMKELMEMKKQADRIKRELEATSVDVSDVKGITIKINGAQKFLSINVAEELLNPQRKKQTEADLLKSLNTAIGRAQNLAADKMRNIMPGFPGM
jgi:DNA-binding protein YbaB